MIQLRIEKIQKILQKEITVVQVANELAVSRKSIHKRICRYKKRGEEGLYPKKPGPKHGAPPNKTPKYIEAIVISISKEFRFKGPITMADILEDEYSIKLHPVTIFRILKRNNVRYYDHYKRYKRPSKLYSLGVPGKEIQLDVSFPMGYDEGVVVYDAIDDCTRLVRTKAYEARNIVNSISFVKHLLSRVIFTVRAIRTDNGSEFGKGFSKFLESIGIEHIKNSAYSPEENGKIERYHRTCEDEDINYWWHNISIDDANYRLKLREYYYNYKRKHRGLGMNGLTPIQKYRLCSIIKV